MLLILSSYQLKRVRLFTESLVVGLCLVVWLQHSQNINVSLGKRERIEKVAGTHADARGLASFTHLNSHGYDVSGYTTAKGAATAPRTSASPPLESSLFYKR